MVSDAGMVFDNRMQDSGVCITLDFGLKQKQQQNGGPYVSSKIRKIALVTEKLTSSPIYNVSERSVDNGKENISFDITLVDISSIKRLGLDNDNLHFTIHLAEETKLTNSIPITVNIQNLLSLNSAKINQITKSVSDCLVDMSFRFKSSSSSSSDITDYTGQLTSYLNSAKSSNEVNVKSSSDVSEQSDDVSSFSEISSLASNLNDSTASLTSISNLNSSSKKSSQRFLSPKLRYLKESSSRKSAGKSGSSSNLLSLSRSASDISSSNPDLYHDDTDGFLILQIESARGLPPFRNSTKLGYDMDPFVVVSFSKQIFKTAVCRHALNPSWKNQLINIRVSKYSFNFLLKLAVYDFDFFTFNDDICSTTIEISNLIDESEYNHSNSWTYKKLPLEFSSKALSRKIMKSQEFMPELSIRFKYVSVASLSAIPHDFNPRTTKCPNCNKIDKRNNSALQHLSICTLDLKPRQFLHKHYTTSSNASRRWYSKVLAHIAYGRLTVGGNNAHILVQDRETGLVLEEKISAFVKLGIRLLYKSVKSDNSSEKIKRMLRLLSIKQGARYDKPDSKCKINGFIKFHGLQSTLNECLLSSPADYKTFNEFFSRRLKPGARPIEGGISNDVVVSVADSRLVVFENVTAAKKLWIKGNGFTIEKLLGRKHNKNSTNNNEADFSVAIFRLAPQDYHRVHCPLNGKILKITQIHGSYYTVNPMAVRSALDVFGENVRTVVTMETLEYGFVEIVLVGAMMVGSILITVELNQTVKKGQELGYFKFGGSTVVLIFQKQKDKSFIQWDGDLVSNSNKKLETLVKVGMSVGHADDKPGYYRGVKKEVSDTERQEVIRRVTGVAEGHQAGMSENLRAKLGGMIDDVMSLKSGGRSLLGFDRTVDDIVADDWEVQELTTLDGLNDTVTTQQGDNTEVEIEIARPLEEQLLFDALDSSDGSSTNLTASLSQASGQL